jgi:hypothetical protein
LSFHATVHGKVGIWSDDTKKWTKANIFFGYWC